MLLTEQPAAAPPAEGVRAAKAAGVVLSFESAARPGKGRVASPSSGARHTTLIFSATESVRGRGCGLPPRACGSQTDRGWPGEETDLSRTCPAAKKPVSKSLIRKGKMVEAAGIEPASAWRPDAASTCVASAQSRWGQSRKQEKRPPWQTWFSSPVAVCPRPGTSLLMTPAAR